jgi:hypothetical protein
MACRMNCLVWLASAFILFSLTAAVSPLAYAADTVGSGDNIVLPPLVPQQNSIYYVPQLGNGWTAALSITSRISITNLRNADGVATVSFFDNSGAAWSVPLNCPQNPSISGSYTSVPLVVEAGKSLTIESLGYGPIAVGWAKVEANCPLLVTASYTVFVLESVPGAVVPGETPLVLGPPPQARERPLWAAGVPPAPCGTMLSLNPVIGPDRVMEGVSNDAGIAVVNPSNQAAVVTAQLFAYSGGAPLAQNVLNVGPLGHYAGYVTEMFPGVTFSQHSQVVVRLSSNVNISAAALQRLVGNGADINAGLPVVPDSAMARTILYDTEYNDDRDHAQRVIPTCEVIGTQNDAADTAEIDYFSVYVGANQTVSVTILTESIGSRMDPVLRLENSGGTAVATASHLATGLLDAMVTYTSAVNATYYIRLGTHNLTSGRDSFYRMFVRVE